MKTGTFTKLLFTGVASGIALGCAVVLATSIPTVTSSNSDIPVVGTTPVSKGDRLSSSAVSQQVVRDDKSNALDITIAILKGTDIAPADRDVSLASTGPVGGPGEIDDAEDGGTDTAAVDPLRIFEDELGEVEDNPPSRTVEPDTETAALTPADEPDVADGVPAEPDAEETERASLPAENEPAKAKETRTPRLSPAPRRRQATVPLSPTPRQQRATASLPVGEPINIIPVPRPVQSRPASAPSATMNFKSEPAGRTRYDRGGSDLAR